MNLRFMLEQICCFRHETLLVKVSWIVSVAHDPLVECAVIKGNYLENDELYIHVFRKIIEWTWTIIYVHWAKLEVEEV